MATTIRRMETSGASGTGRIGVRATLAVGVAIVGCVAMLILGNGQFSANAQRSQSGGGLATISTTGTLSGGSYADTIWELDQITHAAQSAQTQQQAHLSGGSYTDTIWELEETTREAQRRQHP